MDFCRELANGPIKLELLHDIRSGVESQTGKMARPLEVLAFFAKEICARCQGSVMACQARSSCLACFGFLMAGFSSSTIETYGFHSFALPE